MEACFHHGIYLTIVLFFLTVVRGKKGRFARLQLQVYIVIIYFCIPQLKQASIYFSYKALADAGPPSSRSLSRSGGRGLPSVRSPRGSVRPH